MTLGIGIKASHNADIRYWLDRGSYWNNRFVLQKLDWPPDDLTACIVYWIEAHRPSLTSASFFLLSDSRLRIADILRSRSVPYRVLAEVHLFQSFLLRSTNIVVQVIPSQNSYTSDENAVLWEGSALKYKERLRRGRGILISPGVPKCLMIFGRKSYFSSLSLLFAPFLRISLLTPRNNRISLYHSMNHSTYII